MQKSRKNNRKDNKDTHHLTVVLFALYWIALFWILLFKLGVQFSYMENRQVNLIPFREFLTENEKIDWAGTIMNIVIFVPLGIYAGMLFKKWHFGKHLFFFFLSSLLVEGLQLLLKIGAFDITDTITNTLGGVVGLGIFKAIEKMFGSSVKAQKFINVLASIGTASMILFLFLLKTNNLWIKYQ